MDLCFKTTCFAICYSKKLFLAGPGPEQLCFSFAACLLLFTSSLPENDALGFIDGVDNNVINNIIINI